MTTAIFIKTCKKDIEWLKFCIRSIRRYTWGFNEVVVVADNGCEEEMKMVSGLVTQIHYVPEWEDGRIQQQFYKLRAFQYCSSDIILFVDSDCLFTEYCSPDAFMRDGKPVIGKTLYDKVGDAKCWKAPTESYLGFEVSHEYMRWLPWMCRRDTLVRIAEKHPDWEQRLRKIKNNLFSEFNVIGAYIDRFESEDYFITDTDEWEPRKYARQFWSWGGFPPEVMEEVKKILQLKT